MSTLCGVLQQTLELHTVETRRFLFRSSDCDNLKEQNDFDRTCLTGTTVFFVSVLLRSKILDLLQLCVSERLPRSLFTTHSPPHAAYTVQKPETHKTRHALWNKCHLSISDSTIRHSLRITADFESDLPRRSASRSDHGHRNDEQYKGEKKNLRYVSASSL